ncbi:MAG: caspase family protein [Nannocystis sp.]|nr:caspase family protein [Nannocystis sp.]MBA3548338.1 caspase family protein [Nannocystis sp.]
MRSRSSLVALFSTLLGACGNANIQSATPRDQLPDLLVSKELMAEAGARHKVGGGGSNAVAYEPRPSSNSGGRSDDRDDSDSDEDASPAVAKRNGGSGGGGGGGGTALVSAAPQPASYALVIGIEKYRDVTAATGARYDAERFAEMARTTLGVPEDNIHTLLDERAGKSDIAKQIRWLQSNVPAGGRIYVYFSGHGAPDPTSGVSYIVPYDGDPQYLTESAIKMSEMLGDLEKTKAKDVLAIADSCFSGGGGRSVLAPGTRPLVRVQEVKTTARVALLSASSGAEISGPSADGRGGLFSKYLIDAIGSGQADINGDGQISLKELEDWIKPRVKREAKKANRDQTPNVQVGKKLGAPNDFIVSWGYAR